MAAPEAAAPSPGSVAAISNAHRWSIVGLLFTASMLNYMDRATISIALPRLSADLGLGPSSKGVLLSAFFWSYALMQIPIGWLSDRVNLRWLYAGAFTLWSLAQGLTGFAGSLAVLIGLRILLGLGESIYLPGGTRIVSLLFARAERGLPPGLFDAGTRTGLFLDGLLIPWLLVAFGWGSMFSIVGFAALVWLIPWLLVFPGRIDPVEPSASYEPKRPARAKFNRNLFGLCLGFFCFDYYWYLLVTWLPDYLVTVRHLSLPQAGMSAALPYFVFGISQPLGGWIGDRLIRRGWDETRVRKGLLTAAFLTGLLLIPAARVESTTAAVALIVGGSLVGLSTANIMAMLQACAPPNQVALWTGIENFVGNLAGILAPLVTGLVISATGLYAPAFALAAAVLVAGLLSYWLIVGKLGPTP